MSTLVKACEWKKRMEEENKACEHQGIGSILRSRPDETVTSFRRTLSADMSSKKWLAQEGFSQLKKVASSEGFPIVPNTDSLLSSSSSEEEDEEEQRKKDLESPRQIDVWSSIQSGKKEELEQAGQFDIWGSILSKKAEEDSKSSTLPTPYVHPLVKRSTSSLSEKSLEICTENLGSETGSDGFSSYPPSETGDTEEDIEEEQEEEEEKEELGTVSYNYLASKKLPPRSFPPPLPSLARRDGPCVHMRPHRQNGRLVLEAVRISSYNYFHTQRQGGRLLLSFINNTPYEEPTSMENDASDEELEKEEEEEFSEQDEGVESEEEEEEEEVFEEFEKENKEEEVENGIKDRDPTPKLPSRMINIHKSALVMSKRLMDFTNRNPIRPQKLDKIIDFEELTQLPQSLPPPPRIARLIPSKVAVATAKVSASFNPYEYSWRKNPTAAAIIHPMISQPPSINNNNNNNNKFPLTKNLNSFGQQQLLVMRGNKAEFLVPPLRGCKQEPGRSLLLWEPYCIATS